MKKIVWITPDYFWDTDSKIVPYLFDYYDLRWYVIRHKNSKTEVPLQYNIYKLIQIPYRQRDIRMVGVFYKIFKEIKAFNPEVIYNGDEGIPYLYPLAFTMLDRRKFIYEGHEVNPKKRARQGKILTAYFNYTMKRIGFVQVFSKHVLREFKASHPQIDCTYIPMVPKDYGQPTKKLDFGGRKVFLFFGTIRPNKRLDILLRAFTSLDEEHRKKAQLLIYGKFELADREAYQKVIDEYDNIEADFGFIADEAIPNLYCSSHYLVQPYQVVSQSGPTMISYNYNLPIIGSDIDGFTERIEDGKTGYIFKTNDVDDLRRTLEHCIDQDETEYENIRKNLAEFIDSEYSPRVVIEKYRKMLNYVMERNNKQH